MFDCFGSGEATTRRFVFHLFWKGSRSFETDSTIFGPFHIIFVCFLIPKIYSKHKQFIYFSGNLVGFIVGKKLTPKRYISNFPEV